MNIYYNENFISKDVEKLVEKYGIKDNEKSQMTRKYTLIMDLKDVEEFENAYKSQIGMLTSLIYI